jgi:hypothetical protein
MNRLGFPLLLVWALGASPAAADSAGPAEMTLQKKVKILTSPAMAGRGSGSPGLDAAADTLAAWLARAGLEPAFGGSWFQEFPLVGEGFAGEELAGGTARNVAGLLPGRGALAGRYLVVGAHYDHLGLVDPFAAGAATPAAEAYYPGANDNASGVAIVTELIEPVAGSVRMANASRSVLFVFFAGEEVGLQGSSFMVDNMPVAVDSVDAMVNFDTVGQMPQDRLYVSGVGTTAIFATLIEAANTGQLELSQADGGWSGSDHMTFNTREVPVLFLFGGAYRQYNRPTDTWQTLDYAGMVRIADFARRLVGELATVPGGFPWVMVGQAALRQEGASSDQEELNRDTWLGSLPDFTEDVPGYTLAGVFDESPAARAGLQKGDIIVMLGGLAVVDLATFTRALRSHAPGDLVEVILTRDGRRQNVTVVLGDRSQRK